MSKLTKKDTEKFEELLYQVEEVVSHFEDLTNELYHVGDYLEKKFKTKTFVLRKVDKLLSEANDKVNDAEVLCQDVSYIINETLTESL